MKTSSLKSWAQRTAKSKYAYQTLGVVSFLESCCSPLPADLLLPPMVLGNKEEWKKIAFVVFITSVIGGIAGYFIGAFAFDSFGQYLLDTFNLHNTFAQAEELFQNHAVLAILIGALTPVPYKIIAISSGVFGVGFLPFVGLSIVGRAVRYYLEVYVMAQGTTLLQWMIKKFKEIKAGSQRKEEGASLLHNEPPQNQKHSE